MPWRGSRHPGELPTLGWGVLRWIAENLIVPDGPTAGAPLVLSREQARFVLNFYAVDPRFSGDPIRGAALVNGRRVRRAVLSRPKGWGKAEVLSAMLPTPSGWTTVGEIQPGDELFGADGTVIRCLAVHPVLTEADCYRVTLSDGTISTFSGGHLFDVDVFTPSGTRVRKTLNVAEMAAEGVTFPRPLTVGRTKATRAGVARYALPASPVLDLSDTPLPLHPYLLGLWLGDGDSDSNRLTVGDADLPAVLVELGARGIEHGDPKRTGTGWRVRFGDRSTRATLRDLGVLGNKHVPAAYLRAGTEQRAELLRGLMDSDGSIESSGRAEFSSTSRPLAEGTAELIRTLGYRVRVREGVARLAGRQIGPRYRLSFMPRAERSVFALPRKAERQRQPAYSSARLTVTAIEPVPSEPVRCITVSAPDGLYLTGRTMWVTHNSPMLAALTLAEALADVVPDGWDADGEPVGRPWTSLGFKAKAQLVAVSEDQTANTWDPLLEMARYGPVRDAYDLDPLNTFVALPDGLIEFVTSSGSSREGFRPIFSVMDQTESWLITNGGRKLAATIRRNLAKTQGASIETPNAFVQGEDSVAERSWKAYQLQREGRTRGTGILVDHREAPADTDPEDRASLLAGLAVAYGDSADVNGGWVSLDRLVLDYWDPDTEPSDARRYYLNQVNAAVSAWLTQPEWAGCTDAGKVVADRDPVVLGFDGSRRRKGRSTADATALVGCRVSDGHVFLIEVWEQPEGPAGLDWQVPTVLVDLAVRDAFRRFNVVGFYADPAKWESHVAQWEADFGARLRVKATRSNPIEWWMTGGRSNATVKALEAFHGAVVEREMTHDGSSTLARHVLNARMRKSTAGWQIAKEHPDSPNKIDAAVAGVLAWQCRLDALALPPPPPAAEFYVPQRIR